MAGDVPMTWESEVLAAWAAGQRISAVGPGPLEAHLKHARALAALLPPGATSGLDLGCGAGLPGLALAGLRPDMTWVLLDASTRRLRVVDAAIDALGWSPRVRTVHGRAEDQARLDVAPVDVVVARLFGPPAVTAECGAPFLAPGGRMVVTEPPARPVSDGVAGDGATGAETDERWSAPGLAALGLRRGPRCDNPRAQILVATGRPERRFPRQPGVARRRPLW